LYYEQKGQHQFRFSLQ
jgi:alpha-mannosidase